MSNILNPIYDNTIDFKAWAAYLYSIIKKYKTKDIKTIVYAYTKDINEEKNIIERNINSNRNEKPANFPLNLSHMLFDIKIILERIESYNSKFEISRVISSFNFLGIKWNEEQFEIIKQLGIAVKPFIEADLKKIINNSIENHAFDNDAQLKKRLFESINSPYILYVLKSKHSEIYFEEKESDPILPKRKSVTKPKTYDKLQWHTFKIKVLNDDQEENLKGAISDIFKELRNQEFISLSNSLPDFRKIFSGKTLGEIGQTRIVWIGSVAELYHFINCLKPVLKNPKDERWRVGLNCFLDENGNEFKLRSLNQAKLKHIKKGGKEVIESITSNFIQLIR